MIVKGEAAKAAGREWFGLGKYVWHAGQNTFADAEERARLADELDFG